MIGTGGAEDPFPDERPDPPSQHEQRRLPVLSEAKISEMSAMIKRWHREGEERYRIAQAQPVEDLLAPSDYEVVSWERFRGQESLKAHMRVRALAAERRGEAMPPALFVAPPGAGKTTLARLVALTLGRPILTLTRPSPTAELISALRRLGSHGVLFVDEVHLWSEKQQHDLMQLTETGTLDGPRFLEQFQALTVMLATTEPQALVAPLRSRMMIRPTWEPYSRDDMHAILLDMAHSADVLARFSSIAANLVDACAGSPRQARMIVAAARDLIEVGADVTAEVILGFTGIAPDGLTDDHIQYLNALARQKSNIAGVQALAAILNMNVGQVTELERLLLDRHFIELTGQGRVLTSTGIQRTRGF